MRISAVIPTYNRAHTVARAVDSALEQTFALHEVIVVDDGSRDGTAGVMARYGDRSQSPPVRYLRQDNAGPAAARNRGIREAAGDWIAFLDSDDRWLPDKTARQVAALEACRGALMAYCSMWMVPESGEPRLLRAVDPRRLWPRLRYENSISGGSAVLAHRATMIELGYFNESVIGVEDWEMWFRLAQRGPAVCVADPLVEAESSSSSVSASGERMIGNTEKILEQTLLSGLTGPARACWRRRIRASACFHAAMNARGRDRAAELRYLLASLAQWPSPGFQSRRYPALLVTLLGEGRFRRLAGRVRGAPAGESRR